MTVSVMANPAGDEDEDRRNGQADIDHAHHDRIGQSPGVAGDGAPGDTRLPSLYTGALPIDSG